MWDGFDPRFTTLASPDPQAFRPPEQPKNVLEVGLATNFKAARFDAAEPTALLRRLEADIEQARFHYRGEAMKVPVKLKVHDSTYVPLAKWPMLMTGNYRCIRSNGIVPIREAVHGDIDQSREIYEWVMELCTRLGARSADLVPFEKYAEAAQALGKPSAAARALMGVEIVAEEPVLAELAQAREAGLHRQRGSLRSPQFSLERRKVEASSGFGI